MFRTNGIQTPPKNLRHVLGANFPGVTQHDTGRVESQVSGSSSAE